MNDEELRDYLNRFCFGHEHLICSRDLVRQKNLRESDLRKKVNRLRRKAVPIASSREGYFYASNAAELYSTIRQLKEIVCPSAFTSNKQLLPEQHQIQNRWRRSVRHSALGHRSGDPKSLRHGSL